MILDLTKEEISAIIDVLGQMPTASNAWPLREKIIAQVKEVSEDSSE